MRTRMIGTYWPVALALVLSGCSLFGSNKATSTAVTWVNTAVALTQCIGDAAKAPSPELGSQACLTRWVPQLPAADTQLAANVAACARSAVGAAAGLSGDAKQQVLAQGLANCAATYVGPIIQAVQNAAAKKGS